MAQLVSVHPSRKVLQVAAPPARTQHDVVHEPSGGKRQRRIDVDKEMPRVAGSRDPNPFQDPAGTQPPIEVGDLPFSPVAQPEIDPSLAVLVQLAADVRCFYERVQGPV